MRAIARLPARAIGAGAAAALLVALACARPERDPDRVRIAILPFLSYAPLFIAADEGLFADEGLDVELVQLATTDVPLALARGEVDVASNYLTVGLFTSIRRGARLRLVADKGHEDPGSCAANALVAGRDLVAGDGAVDLRSLRGRRMDMRTAQLQEYWLEALLGRWGLSLGDFEILQVPQPAKLEALRSGGLDLLAWSEPYLTQAIEAGVAVLVARPADVLPGQQWAFVAFGRSLLDERPDVGERVMVAYLRGVERYVTGDRRRNATIVAAHTGLPADVVERSCWLAIRTDGAIDTASVVAFQRWAVAKGYLEGEVPVEAFWEPRFVSPARARLAASVEGGP